VSGGEVTWTARWTAAPPSAAPRTAPEAAWAFATCRTTCASASRPKPGSVGAETDPRVAAVSEGKDADRAARDLAH